MINKSSIIFLILLFCRALTCQGQVIIPSPQQITLTKGCFSIKDKGVTVYAEDSTATYLSLLIDEVVPHIQMCDAKEKADLCFVRNPACPPEGYTLHITPDNIKIEAADNAGFTYSVQTLRQWVQTGPDGEILFQCVDIVDAPRIKWRSFMLDSGRQYQSPATIKKYIDMASLLKMNYFHWHLTEGLGWRVEIKQYPLLTQKGAYAAVGEEQQGFYSQEEIKALVDYASARNITIVPEIDMPGHAEAALHSYPELGCFNRPVEIPKLGFTPNIFCAGKENTLQFLKNVLDEICTLFPSSYIHLGGDEAPKDNWNKCPDCQKRIADLGLKNSHDLQLWFSAQMAEYLKSKGKKLFFGEMWFIMTAIRCPTTS